MSVAAFFDVDGTLTDTTVLDPLIWYQRAHLSRARFYLWYARLAAEVPYFLYVDRRSRARFNEVFFRRYAGLNSAHLVGWHRQEFDRTLRTVLFPSALERIRAHQKQGHRIVLVTGGLDFVIRPLAEFFGADELIALRLVEQSGVYTGELTGPPVAEEEKARLVRAYTLQHGVELQHSFAYGNAMADAAMLACTGNAIAINPDSRLQRLASEKKWTVENWRTK